MAKNDSGEPRNSFLAAFGAVELISEGYLTEARIKGLEIRKLGELVAAVKKQRDTVRAEAARVQKEADEAQRRADDLKKQQTEAAGSVRLQRMPRLLFQT